MAPTDCQRLLLQIQHCVGIAAVGVTLTACEGSKKTEPLAAPIKKTRRSLAKATSTAAKANTGLSKSLSLGSAAKSAHQRPPLPSYLLGDPPFVEGFDPEEVTCVTGNWCGPLDAAMVVIRPGTEEKIDPETKCPQRLLGRQAGELDLSAAHFKGLSKDRMMRGSFQPWRTRQLRSQGKGQGMCCYHWFNYCAGRPLDEGKRSEQGRRAAEERAFSQTQAMAVARAYWADADDEYDSVAAFARASLELFALSAPAELIRDCQLASIDEIEHARLCRALSMKYYAHAWPVRPPTQVIPREADLVRLLEDTLREACVGESIAALRASRQREQSDDAQVREALEAIARDEARHAALGWKILRWGIKRIDAAQRMLLADAIGLLRQEIFEAGIPEESHPCAIWSRAGRLSPAQQIRCARDAWTGVVEPMLASLKL